MRRRRGAGGAVVVVFILLMGVVLSQLPSSGEQGGSSALSAEDGGKRALYLMLTELGFTTRLWTETPSELPRGEGLLWLSGVPTYPAGLAELAELETAPEGARTAIDPHDPAHYRRFVDEGGTLVCVLSTVGTTKFIAEELHVSIPLEGYRSEAGAPDDSLLFLPTEEQLESSAMAWFRPEYVAAIPGALVEGVRVVTPDANAPEDAAGELELPGLVRVPVGRGSLLLLVSERPFDNAHLRKAQHARFATRLVEEYAHGGPVLFDEYSLGRWTPGSLISVATAPNLILLTAHALLLFVLFTLYKGWVRAFPRDDVPPEPLSALARVRSRASVLLRGGRPALLAEQLRAGVLRELYAREKLRRSPLEEPDYEREVAELLGPTAEREEVATWVARLAISESTTARELPEFREKLDSFSDRIRTGRVHASAQKGIM